MCFLRKKISHLVAASLLLSVQALITFPRTPNDPFKICFSFSIFSLLSAHNYFRFRNLHDEKMLKSRTFEYINSDTDTPGRFFYR